MLTLDSSPPDDRSTVDRISSVSMISTTTSGRGSTSSKRNCSLSGPLPTRSNRRLALDQFICFSAFAGVYGNPGQADYAAANAFMDLYADYRNEMVRKGHRQGDTLSIGWPLWAEGGMQMDEVVKTRMARSGLTSLSAPMGLSALYRSLSMKAASAQIVVLHGDVEKLSGLVSGSVSAWSVRNIRRFPEALTNSYRPGL